MGRPLNKRNFGFGEGNQIKVRAKIGTNAEGDGYIVKQKGSKRYIVTVGANSGICKLVNKTSGTLLANEMIVNAINDAGALVQATKLYNRVAIVGAQNTKKRWTYDADLSDGAIQLLDVEGPLLAFSTNPQSLTVDLDDQETGDGFVLTAEATGVAASSITYTWQLSTDDGENWTTLSNNATYSGATTNTLTVAATSYDWDGYQYRAVATAAGVSNSPLASQAAILTVLSTYDPS
jgi:hypothetical protein